MSFRKYLLGFLVGVFAACVVFVGFHEPNQANTTRKTIAQTRAQESHTSDRIQRHNFLFWYNESAGLVEPSLTTDRGWAPVDVDYLFIPFYAGNLVSIDYGSYDTNAVGGGESVEILVQLPIDCLLYTSPSPRDRTRSRMPSSA